MRREFEKANQKLTANATDGIGPCRILEGTISEVDLLDEVVVTVDAKYVFLDIVGFTRNRSVEAQSDIVGYLNGIVKDSLAASQIPEGDRILLPTGDGICIAITSRRLSYDIHVQLALAILKRLHAHNADTENEMRRFEVRIGINANTDNLVTDINGSRNVAGAGINAAQRVMDSADGNQVLVSHAVHETLRHRERYIGTFRSYTAKTKHDEQVPVHQLLIQNATGLNLDEPQAFITQKKKQPKLTEHVAYYLAHAIANHGILIENKDSIYNDYAVVTLLYFLAKDSEKQSQATELETVYPDTYKAGSATFLEQYEYYRQLDNDLVWDFARFVQWSNSEYLSRYNNCFGTDRIGLIDYRAVSESGKRKLNEEWPQIWDEFGLDQQPT